MLNWWLGKPTDGISRVGEDEQEPPETPAPVFAARALKTAIFGTPAPPDDTVYENEKEAEEEGDGTGDAAIEDIMDPTTRNESPTKPPGILLTPGTGTTRRKTVSFGNEVVDNEGRNGMGRSGIPNNCPGKFPSPWSAKGESKSAKKTALTRTLESAREGKSGKVGLGMSGLRNEVVNSEDDEDGARPKEPKRNKGLSQKGDQDLMRQSITRDDFDGDMTLDLNEPHSQSGKYWKSNYDQYHEEAKAEMKKLLKYKQLAKSYAKKKDAEAIDLGQKLKEEKRKVICMEEKISELGALIATNGMTGSEDDSPELIKELARQTALTLQYKTLVDEFQDAYQDNQGHANDGMTEKRYATARNERALLEIQKELNRAREKLREMEDLRNEMHSLRLSLSASERKNSRLQDENAKLSQDLKRANVQVEREEKRRQSMEEQRERRDGAFQVLQDDYDNLKELNKRARQDDQEVLKKRQEQVKELKKMVLASQQEVRTCKQTIEQYKAAEDAEAAERKFFEPSPDKEVRSKSRSGETKQDPATRTITKREDPRPRESAIPVLAASALKNAADTRTTQPNTPIELPRPRSSHAALSEVVNSASPDASPVKKPGTPGLTPFANRFSNMTLESPLMELPSPEPSLLAHSTNKAFDEKVRPSPRPSMFNIPSSPPKTMVPRPRPASGLSRTNGLSRQKSTSDLRQKSIGEISEKATELSRQKLLLNLDGRQQTNMGSSRISSSDGSRVRSTLPPERAAAARARLEQRMIEKKAKRAKEMDLDKENIR